MENITDAICFFKNSFDQELLKEADDIFKSYSSILKPNRKPLSEILDYIRARYPTEEDTSERARKVVLFNTFGGKSEPADVESLKITVLNIKNEGTASRLYDLQEQEFKELVDHKLVKDFPDIPFDMVLIRILAEALTGYLSIEGSQALADEVMILRGLDEKELKDKFQVANYVHILKRNNLLE